MGRHGVCKGGCLLRPFRTDKGRITVDRKIKMADDSSKTKARNSARLEQIPNVG